MNVIPNYFVNSFIISLILSLICSKTHANPSDIIDRVIVPSSQSNLDKRTLHKHEVINRALELTVEEYGQYSFSISEMRYSRHRALLELETGENINLYIALADQRWNERALPIKIPIRMGALSYRLFLINKNNLDLFNEVSSIYDLQNLKIGLQSDWSIKPIFEQNNFNIVEATNFDSLFLMLNYQRFDYIPRGVHEVFEELESREQKIPDVVLEPNIALYLKAASYAYVSPEYPRLAERLTLGLNRMVDNGELLQILLKHYSEDFQKGNLSERTLIKLSDDNFVDPEVSANEKLWLSPVFLK